MEVRSKTGFNQIIFGVVFILVAFLAYRIILYTESQLLLLLGATMAVLIIVSRPILGLATYLVIYPMVPAEEAVTPLKTAVLGLIVLILAVWVIQNSLRRSRVFTKPEYRWLFFFFFFLCFSPLLGIVYNFSTVDWGRGQIL